LEEVFVGILESIDEDVSIYSCIHDVTNEDELLKEAVEDIESEEASRVLDGIKLIA